MNKAIFGLLLSLLALGLLFPSFKIAMILALIKVMLVVYFYMELHHAHTIWKFAMTGLVLATFGGVLFLST